MGFRSVAMRLIRGLNADTRAAFQLDVLRPPTFDRLGRVLREASKEGQPYHIVHFDGHGTFLDLEKIFREWQDKTEDEIKELEKQLADFQRERFSPQTMYPRQPRTGRHGYLCFENPTAGNNLRLVGGQELGALLVETGVGALVLNACLSAHAEASQSPESADGDTRSQVRTFGSLAQETMEAGVAGVVAMRYSVYVVTAARFVENLYTALGRGHTLDEAVTLGRKQLHDDPLREVGYEPRPLQDWMVPVVYDAARLSILPRSDGSEPTITAPGAEAAGQADGRLDPGLPHTPDVGFFGRDETLLALDRAFDTQPIVLLHAYAGSGKSTAAAEFARWYRQTGGVEGPVLYTSFERYTPLARVLDQIERTFGGRLERSRVNWLALPEDQRRQVALQLLQQVPLLWVWDNVEPVAGFPSGTESDWSPEEQRELADFLRAAKGTRAKFLLTSRRDEQGWLQGLPARIQVPSMPMPDRVAMARALAQKRGRRLAEVEDWRPLLEFTKGNPLAITVLVGQALRDGRRTRDQVEAFVAQLRAGEAAFDDEDSEGRSSSLGASLGHGFEHAFDEDQRRRLALLHLFQGFVDVNVLRVMGDPEAEWCLPELRGLTRQEGMELLDRAAEVGLLTALGGGYYTIHPALPWFFKGIFDQYYPASKPEPEGDSATSTLRAFVEAMGGLGQYYHSEYERGNRDVIALLTLQETNLLHARQLARSSGLWGRVISNMQGLSPLYYHTGRLAEWARLVEGIVPDFVDPATGGPQLGREEDWSLVDQYRVRLARQARRWAEAESIQKVAVEWNRQRAVSALFTVDEQMDDPKRNYIRSLAVSLNELAQIQRQLGQKECIAAYEEAFSLSERIGDRSVAADCASNLAYTHMSIHELRDLAQAELWLHRALELRPEGDRLGRGKNAGQLGTVAYERFLEAREAKRSKDETLKNLNEALRLFLEAPDHSL